LVPSKQSFDARLAAFGVTRSNPQPPLTISPMKAQLTVGILAVELTYVLSFAGEEKYTPSAEAVPAKAASASTAATANAAWIRRNLITTESADLGRGFTSH
jgi:hypothetical protein